VRGVHPPLCLVAGGPARPVVVAASRHRNLSQFGRPVSAPIRRL